MEKTLAEFQIIHRNTEDEIWTKNDVRPADLRLRVTDNNLVKFEYFNGDAIVGAYRLCWQGFMEFVHNFQKWFLEDEPANGMTPSCVDKEQNMRCMVHSDLVVSFTIGKDKPEIVFCGNRGDVLTMFDNAARFVADLPEAGCFRMAETMEKMNTTVAPSEEVLAKMESSGHTVH